jgi:hypothetical protein
VAGRDPDLGLTMPYVYFFIMYDPADPPRDFGLVKVGITDGDVVDRIGQLQTGNPWELRCVDAFKTSCAREVEHFVHRTHAAEMQHLEWLRWPRDALRALIEEAREAARRIEERKAKENGIIALETNGEERRPDREEIHLHREARALKKLLVPAKLRLLTAEARLKAATGATRGIPGVVRVTRVLATTSFNPELAERNFPALAEKCRVEEMSGAFHWRNVPRPSHFMAEKLAAEDAIAAAEASARDILERNIALEGWTPRTAEAEQYHDEFLRMTGDVSRLEGDLADLESELTVRLGEHDALVNVCSYKRRRRVKVDAAVFCKTYPDEAARCADPVAEQLRKYVYPTRAYW